MPNISVNIEKKKKIYTAKDNNSGDSPVYEAKDYVGCWNQVEGPEWYESTKITFNKDHTWSLENKEFTKIWAWSPNYVNGEDFGNEFNDWHFKRGKNSDDNDTLTILANPTWHGGAETAVFMRC